MKTEVGLYATMSSSDGCNSIVLHARESIDEMVDLHISVINRSTTVPMYDGAIETQIPVLTCPVADFALLVRPLSSWLIDKQPFKFELKCLVGRLGRFEICLDEDFICSIDKPVFRFTYAEHRFAIESRYVVDQSCIRQFLEGLQRLK